MDSSTVSNILQILQMPLEIKMEPSDTERKYFAHLRSWTRSTVKVEAVKCFPCYMKLSIPNIDGENLSIRIQIPGLSVQVAASRTKQHSYGMFWKQNRKRCCAFLAFDNQKDCDQHMKWVKYWIKCLEYSRQDMLVKRRATRSRDDDSIITNRTDQVRNINEVLGPLPPIPVDLDQEWMRRQSMSVSGIYEDIDKYRKDDTTFYVETVEELFPTLPPRRRANTRDFGIRRSQTNSAVDYSKLKVSKKSWTSQILQGITKRFETPPKSPRKASLETADEPKPKLRHRRFKSVLDKNKRKSFSSPDLFHIPDTVNVNRGTSPAQSWEFNFFDGPGKLNISTEILNGKRTSTETASSGISADFEASNWEPIYQVPKNIPVENFFDDNSGYCVMASPKPRRRQEECPYTIMTDDPRPDSGLPDCNELNTEPIYTNIEPVNPQPQTPEKTRTPPPPPPTSCTFDEKIPSYYANEVIYARPKKPIVTRTHAKNNIYTSPPIREAEVDGKSKSQSDLVRRNSFSPAIPKSKGHVKYATIGRSEARLFQNNVQEPPTPPIPTSTTNTLSRKFQSLPKFHLDLTPLRMKLNSVLQRYQQSGM